MPYLNHKELNEHWIHVTKKCLFLKKLNFENKKLLNQKFYLNQYFLDLFQSYKNNITYDISGNIPN